MEDIDDDNDPKNVSQITTTPQGSPSSEKSDTTPKGNNRTDLRLEIHKIDLAG